MDNSLSKNSAVFLAIVLVAGTVSTMIPESFSQSYEDSYAKEYDKKKSTGLNYQKIKCFNSNVNTNGVDTQVPSDPNNVAAAQIQGTNEQEDGYVTENAMNDNEQGHGQDLDNNLVNTCINYNDNEQAGGQEEGMELQTGSLTVKKEIFGCNNFININEFPFTEAMDCDNFVNEPPSWISCTNSLISDTEYCLGVPPNTFDIQVLDNQFNLIQQFEGSQRGITIQNLPPGTYIINEIVYATSNNQLRVNPNIFLDCQESGFSNGGEIINTNGNIDNAICLDFKDEQGNDCNTLTLATGEDKTCIVKNYIKRAILFQEILP